MSFLTCINNAIKEGRLRPSLGQELKDLYDAALRQQDLFGPEASMLAARSVFSDFKDRVKHKKRKLIQSALAQEAIARDIRGHRHESGRINPYDGAKALLDSQPFGGKPGAWQRWEAIKSLFHDHLHQLMPTFERNLLGSTRNKATLTDLVDELFGKNTGNGQASAYAKAWRDTAELARQMYNAAGGAIGKLQDWGLPQAHDWLAISNAGWREWRNFIFPLLDRSRMVDGVTGNRLSDRELLTALRQTYDNISTEGWANRDISAVMGGRSHANRRMDHRFLHFTDGAAWRQYQERFGEGDAFAAMNGYIDGMARDIALMQRFGPNPTAGLTYAKNLIESDAAKTSDPKAKNKARATQADMDRMFRILTGQANSPTNPDVARVFGNVRQYLVSAQLGSAALSALSDPGFAVITAKYNGMSATNVLRNQMKLLNPRNQADRDLAVMIGLLADEATNIASAQQRYIGEVWGGNLTHKLADGVLRVSGLSPWTQAGRWAFGMEFSAMLARERSKGFADLQPELRRALERYAITAEDWDLIRQVQPLNHKGVDFLRGDDIRTSPEIETGRAEELAIRVLSMIRSETNFAVPSVSLYGKAKVFGDVRPGNIPGELLRSVATYKGFAVTLLMTHMRRMALQTTWRGKFGYGFALIATTGLMGALSLQMKEVSKGRDPRPMTGENANKFWLAAMYQGGGLGLFGDFLFSDQNRFGGGVAEAIAGPVIAAGGDVMKLSVGNVQELIDGKSIKDTKLAREMVDFIGRYHPGASLWYTRLAEERLLLDTMRELTDPTNAQRNRRIERRYAREFEQQFWWWPGDMTPERPPDIAGAFQGDDHNANR